MKPLKISLAILVVAAIIVGVVYAIQRIAPPPPPTTSKNPFILEVEQGIEELKLKPSNKFCKDYFNEVAFQIAEFSKPSPPEYPYGRLGESQLLNKQQKEILEQKLFVAYIDLFKKQTEFVFSGSEWNPEDLEFIQREKDELKRSKLLISGSSRDSTLTKFQIALDKYNEISSFIKSCKNYYFLKTELAENFPFDEVESKIYRSESLRIFNLENKLVNNCSHLHENLREIPEILVQKHVRYLDNKIDYWRNKWCYFVSHRDYAQNLNTPLRNEINELGNAKIYSGIDIDIEYERLSEKWSTDNQKAYNATYPCN